MSFTIKLLIALLFGAVLATGHTPAAGAATHHHHRHHHHSHIAAAPRRAHEIRIRARSR